MICIGQPDYTIQTAMQSERSGVPKSKGSRRGIIWFAAWVILFGAACTPTHRNRAPNPVPSQPNRDIPNVSGECAGWNVLLITIDALRNDHLSCHGYARRTTPVIDNLAAEGVDFYNCFAQAPHTHASIASLMTGMYPFRHGSVIGSRRLRRDNETIAETLIREHYSTGAFVLNYWLSEEMGFSQGFETYQYSEPGSFNA